MSANPNKITTTLTCKPIPPPACLTGGNQDGSMVEMVAVSKHELLMELDVIGVLTRAAFLWCQQSDSFRAEKRLIAIQKRLANLALAITGDDPVLHDELCRRGLRNTGR